jgi:hypothetical protein
MRKIIGVVAVIGTIGTALVALEQFFGVPIRPAWAWETAELEEKYKEQRQEIQQIQLIQQESIDILSEVSRSGQAQLTNLNKGQLRLQLHLYKIERRDLNRELARFQALEAQILARGETVPDSIIRSVSDTQSEIHEIDKLHDVVQIKLIGLEGINHEE